METRRIDLDETTPAARENGSRSVSNLTLPRPFTSFPADFPALDDQISIDWHRPTIFDRQLRGHCMISGKSVHLGHNFVEKRGDDAAVDEAGTSLVIRVQPNYAADALLGIVLLKRELHASRIGAATTEAVILRIWF
jgi:hypothetical protein